MIKEMKLDIQPTTLGIDVGSTTVKLVLIKGGSVEYECYVRHHSKVRETTLDLVRGIGELAGDKPIKLAISGSAGYGLATEAGLPFIQEVFATGETVKRLEPDTGVVIELGGEDAKVIFFTGVTDERMNGTCAGGTGAFIDQMASLLNVSVTELDELSLNHTRIYPIASRCGVFAKTDIQPLINQGARKEDIAASVYQAVVNQTISGLVQGYDIDGKVMFLGGPLYYCKGLRERFKETLNLSDKNAVFPEYGLLSVALGAAIYASDKTSEYTFDEIVRLLTEAANSTADLSQEEPLFASGAEYDEFVCRHSGSDVPEGELGEYEGGAYLGIDCGSTTTKLVLIGDDDSILYKYYGSNLGSPTQIIKKQLENIYSLCTDKMKIKSSAVTGYGEELVLHAFGVDRGIVETMAHFFAAKHFNPDVDFIMDIGGQDMKCFKIRNNSIDSILLNEACSSGCGSFIETFAHLAGYDAPEFARLGLKSKHPVDLGSRCTVFMNSSVKQAQKDGASVEDISAGLSMSVVKNAIYKVLRVNSADELGKNIVVQGGTFLNDAILRSFEKEVGTNVIRPKIAGLMGAYGAALYAKNNTPAESTLITPEGLKNFTHTVKAVNCSGCENHCNLTINIFGDKKFVSGNKCEKGSGVRSDGDKLPDIYEYKRDRLTAIGDGDSKGPGATVGLPMALGMYELAPFWHGIFADLGFNVIFSALSSRKTYIKGQHTIPSDTACYPAKLMHGHIEELLEKGADMIFYPCLTYNFDEHTGDNHYNCPVVAYYSELLNSNIKALGGKLFMPYLNINDNSALAKELQAAFGKRGYRFTRMELKSATKKGLAEYGAYMDGIHRTGEEYIDYARKNGKRILVLAGRPYHTDPEICHLIDKLATSLGFVVVSEDAVCDMTAPAKVDVLNQWTYHARLYNAAKYVTEHDDCNLVQLVSFGCGIDAITTDEVRAILEDKGKIYTQLKIDEINNLGAVKIRLRSLIAALEEREGKI